METPVSARLSRRDFVRVAAGATVVGGWSALAGPALGGEKPRWPVGCRDAHLQHAGTADCWSAVRLLGAEALEVNVAPNLDCPGLFHPNRKYSLATDAGRQTLAADLAGSGSRIAAFMMANRLDERLEEELEWTRRLVKAASRLGVEVIRIDVVPRKLRGDAFLTFAIEACRKLCALAADTPIRYGVENHGQITNDPAFLEKLFAGVGSAKLGMTLDVANFYWWGHPLSEVYAIYERFAPRAFHTHCKSIRYPEDKRNIKREMGWEYAKYNCPIHEGDIDFKRVIEILRRANYQGDLCVEDESLGKFPQAERAEVLKQQLRYLKDLQG